MPLHLLMMVEELYKIYQQYPSVQTDTRKLKAGDIFFALKGPNFNGNSFARQAIDNGAACVVIDEKEYEIRGKTFLVPDVLLALQHLSLHHRKQFDIPFIAITGSNGKTTTKELIHSVLSSSFKTYTTEGNLNNHIGIPLTILKIKADAEMAVIEMGANHLNEIASYCQIALPTHGLITNCGKAHLEGFGSEEGVRKGKGELFEYLRTLTHGFAFVMWDYDYLHKIRSAIENYTPSNSRSQLVEKGSNKIILDAYNANPSSMKVAIENFANKNAKDKILLLGAMAELGKESLLEHKGIIDLIKKYSW